MLCISKYSEMSKLKNPSRLSRRLGCLDNPSDLKTSHCTQWGINEHGSIYCHPNVASFMILHPLTADAVLKCQVITQHSPTCWSTGQFHPIPFSLPYCINCPLHLHFHPSLTGHVSVLDVSFFSIFAINIQCPSFHWAIWLSPKLGDASTHLMVGCSYDDNGMVQHIVYIVHFTSTSTPHLLVTCLS